MRHLLCQYPNHEFHINGYNEVIAVDEMEQEHLVCSGARYQIEQHFEGRKLIEASSDGDPQKETYVKVSGYTYVKRVFNGNHDDALLAIIEE